MHQAKVSFQAETSFTTRETLPYEINEMYFDQDYFYIKGWGFVNGLQHFKNEQTHSYVLQAKSDLETLTFTGEHDTVSQTDYMYYSGSRMCRDDEFMKESSQCNYYYENVGFRFKIPLKDLKRNQRYQLDLIVYAHNIKQHKIIHLYYPLENDVIYRQNNLEYKAISRLQDTKLMINHGRVIVRDQPSKFGKHLRGESSCSWSYGNYLYFDYKSVFEKIYERKNIGSNTYYRLGGQTGQCKDGRLRIVEGTTIQPIWILSNFVDYSGAPLTIEVLPIKKQTSIRFIDSQNALINNIPSIWDYQKLFKLLHQSGSLYTNRY